MIITQESIRNFFLTCFGVYHSEKEINNNEIEMKPIKKKQNKKRSFTPFTI